MTDEQKNRIRKLRKRGFSYRQVADDLDISVNTVKSFCRRDSKVDVTADTGMVKEKKKAKKSAAEVCRFCGKPLVMVPGKRKKEFCDSKCRSRYWTVHRNELCQKTTYTFRCAHCGKEFTIYGKRDRKYCSPECYFADRFGEH